MDRRFWLGLGAYVIVTFPLGFVWHLVVFAPQYHALQTYRPDIIIPLGLTSMFIQGVILSWLFPRLPQSVGGSSWLARGLVFGLVAGLFAWSLTALPVAAKHVMTSVPLYLVLESGFTAIQYGIVGLLLALVHRR